MDPNLINLAISIAGSLAPKVIEGGGRLLKKQLHGDEKKLAVKRCLTEALKAMLNSATWKDPPERDLVGDIFRKFFKEKEVAPALAELIKGNRLNRGELLEIFKDVGYDPQTLPGLDFERAINAYEKGFIDAAVGETELQGIIQTEQLLGIREVLEQSHQLHKEGTGHQRQATELLKKIEQKLPELEVDRDNLRKAYLTRLFHVAREEPLAWVGFQAADKKDNVLNLDAVYTALRTITPEAYQTLQRGETPQKEARYLTALEELNRHKYLVLQGDPGSGKTTFVDFVALCLAGEALDDSIANIKALTDPLPEKKDEDKKPKRQPWGHGALLPVRVILRDFAARGLPKPGQKAAARHLWNFICEELGQKSLGGYAEFLEKELRNTGTLLLLDGLDEVPDARDHQRRAQVKDAVEDFTVAFPECRILVTSRTYAYQKQEWQLQGFAQAILAPFSDAQIEHFIDRWYCCIGERRGWHEDKWRSDAASLREEIFGGKRLREMAERPLLLTLMADLHVKLGGRRLPEKREELYSRAVELLLEQWEKPKIVRTAEGEEKTLPAVAEWLKIDRDQVRKLLNELAFEAHRTQPEEEKDTADIPAKELQQGLLNLSKNPKVKNPDIKPLRLEEYLRDRAGILVERGVDVYTFPHRTFQEYLAACHLADDESFPDKIAELACSNPNRWREVAMLAGAKAAGMTFAFWSFVDGFCPREIPKNEPDSTALWGAHLAGQALAELADQIKIGKANQPKIERVQNWLVYILSGSDLPPLERAAAGVNLAHLGDLRPEVMSVDDMQFCFIPGGDFYMGEGKDERLNKDLQSPYWLGRFPVTNAQFREFVDAGGYGAKFEKLCWQEAKKAGYWSNTGFRGRTAPEDYGTPYNLPNHPVVGVSWYEALAFTRWLTERWENVGARHASPLPPGWEITLPTETQWGKAARGGLEIPSSPIIRSVQELSINNWQLTIDNYQPLENLQPRRIYPWGDNADPDFANYDQTGIGATSAVGCFPRGKTPYGCEEMSGNVWEWCENLYGKRGFEGARALRGGSWGSRNADVRCSARVLNHPDVWPLYSGFRVVVCQS